MRQILILFSLAVSLSVDTVAVESDSKLPVDSICADFCQFVDYLEDTHPDPYSVFGGRPLFFEEAARVKRGLIADSVTDPVELARRISEFVARLRDGHTQINIPGGLGPDRRFAPVRFRHVADGMTVRSVPDSLKCIVGSRLMGVNGMAIDEIRRKLSTIATAENESGEYENIRYYINDGWYLSRLLPDFKGDSVTFDVMLPDNRMEHVRMPMLTDEKLKGVVWYTPQPTLELPADNFAYTFLDPDCRICYFRFNNVNSRDNFTYMKKRGMSYESQLRNCYRRMGKEMPENPDEAINALPVAVDAFGDMLVSMKEKGSGTLIIDLRKNEGGWTPIVYPMMYELFGKSMLGMDSGVKFYRRISPLYLQKINLTLEKLNRPGRILKLGDYTISGESAPAVEPDAKELDRFIDNMMTLNPERLKKLEGKPIYTPENIYVVTDGGTFSAAFHTTFYLWRMGAKVAGVPSSQAPDTFMEATAFRLPRTGLSGSISNSLQMMLPYDDPNAGQLNPEIRLDYETLKRYGYNPDAEILQIIDIVR